MHGVSRRWERLNVEIQHCDNSGEPIIGKLWSKGHREGWVRGKTVVSMGGTVSKLNLVHECAMFAGDNEWCSERD